MEYYSPLRYPGGKAKVSFLVQRLFESNGFTDGVYVEPYAGGASVALSLLYNEYASHVVINDKDRAIYAFWHSVLNKNAELCDLIERTPITLEVWNRQRSIFRQRQWRSHLELGFATFFLNRTNRSGILDAGPIGGKEQDGQWKLDARYNKSALIDRIQKVGEYSGRITLKNLDAVHLIQTLLPNLPAKTLFYFDPPYFLRGKDLYLNYYDEDDHADIATALNSIKDQRWILTYDNADEIRKLYFDKRIKTFDLAYSAADHRKGTEIMVFSDNLILDERFKENHLRPRDFAARLAA